ncbi:uracil-DNA glycosylase [Lichenibacterium dinghuense]|uniref:uracil-DNA glycosylase n=1 Tax=Lichenibacterium dinghuense TaxID=2895977 RepID=UPI001F373218|nr:uracil-DNA glycosylase [Lichenibacterium sp. 6Y81]
MTFGVTPARVAAIGPAEPAPDCPLCPRLVAFRAACRERDPAGYNAPVRSFGPTGARLLVVGLAPGRDGANHSGRPFTGDWAGDLLYETLDLTGFATGRYEERPDDGLTLVDCMVTNAVRCVPPANKPVPAEIATCRAFLVERMAGLPELRAVLALGRIAHESVVRALRAKLSAAPFGHGRSHDLALGGRPLRVFDSYHCSRYNTNTGVLTPEMFRAVFAEVRAFVDRG